MKRLINYLRGMVRVSVTGMFPERVINLCAQNRIDFWAVEWQDEYTVSFTIRHQGLPRVREYAEKIGCQITQGKQEGFPAFLRKFRKRYAFLIGLGLSLCVVSVLSRFILTVEVSGNERVSEAVILQQLQRYGVYPGAYGPALDRRQIEQEILLEMKDLSWMTINLHGTRAEIQVREKQDVPARIDEYGFFHVVAEADGIVTQVEPELGDALVKEGDIVGKGDILISGTVTLEPPQYSDLPERYYELHARGRVWARTWRQLEGVMPCETLSKKYTNREKKAWSIFFFGKRVEFFGNSSILDGFCDKITSVRQIELPGGTILPVWVVCETYRQYEPAAVSVELNAASGLMEEQLQRQLKDLVGADGQILNTEHSTRVADGLICVTTVGECLEEIGREISAHSDM